MQNAVKMHAINKACGSLGLIKESDEYTRINPFKVIFRL
jgi:hypothetical protein